MELEQLHIPPPEIDGDGDEATVSVHLSIVEDDGTHRAAHTHIDDQSDDAVAAAIAECLRGVAAMRGPGLQLAIAARLQEVHHD